MRQSAVQVGKHRPGHGQQRERAAHVRPAEALLLTAQRNIGNAAVASLGAAAVVQRLNPGPTHTKTRAKEMTSDEGLREHKRVVAEVEQRLQKRAALLKGGTAPEIAARVAFHDAPADILRYLPLFADADIDKQAIDRVRTAEAGERHSAVSEAMAKHAAEHGYEHGKGDPSQAKPKTLAKELEEEKAFERQKQRIVERDLRGRALGAEVELEAAKASGDKKLIAEAERKLAELTGPNAFHVAMMQFEADRRRMVLDAYAAKLKQRSKDLGNVPLTEAEKQRQREKAEKKIDKQIEGGLNPRLVTAGKVMGGIGSHGAKAVKHAGKRIVTPAVKKHDDSKATGSKVKGSLGSIGTIVSSIGGLFSKAVKLASTVNDKKTGQSDQYTDAKIAEQSAGIVKLVFAKAKAVMKIVQAFDTAAKTDPGLLQAIPGVSIFAAGAGIAGNAAASVEPVDRLVKAKAAIAATPDAVLRTALERTEMESALSVSSEAVGFGVNVTKIILSIVEAATVGGFGVPAALKLGLTAVKQAKDMADRVTLEIYRSKTQDARKKGALQVEGSGERLMKVDIGYAADKVIMAAQAALAKPEATRNAADDAVIAVIESFGISPAEAARLTMREMHERVLDKLGQDDEQETLRMKMAAAVKEAKEVIDSLGGPDKTKDMDLDEYKRHIDTKPKQSTGQKLLGYLKKVPDLPAAAGKAVKGVIDDAADKEEKIRKLHKVKQALAYKDHSNRSQRLIFKNFVFSSSDDIDASRDKLRHWIMKHPDLDDGQKKRWIGELLTEAERKKMKKVSEQADKRAQAAQASPEERVIDPVLFEEAQKQGTRKLEAMMAAGPDYDPASEGLSSKDHLGPADVAYLKHLLAERSGKLDRMAATRR